MAQTVLFELVKDTKNTRKYAEVPDAGQPPKIGTLYVQKWWANGAQRLRVTIEREVFGSGTTA